jgi:hypothetical protein
MKKEHLMCIALLATLTLAGCAAGHNPAVNTAATDGTVAGFWLGLWHGMIVLITFIISLFSDNVHFYEVHNNGGWYNFGFVLGFHILAGSVGKASS